MRLSDIQIRDPFVLVEPGEAAYYLFGSTDPNIWSGPGVGFDCYRSTDLREFDGPVAAFRPPAGFWSPGCYWAPEVYRVGDAWFMFATFGLNDRERGTQVLRATAPAGPYEVWSDGPVTPAGWLCLDGTLHVDADGPWMVFCHEWPQVGDGEMCAVRLTDDLRAATGEPTLLFRASDAAWANTIGEVDDPRTPGAKMNAYVTDGPFLHRAGDGSLLMLWSSYGAQGYAMGVARSASGTLAGPWAQETHALWAADGGHGMVFRDLGGQLMLTLHQPNTTPHERAVFVPLREADNSLKREI
jgi:hypothetical protein